MLKLAEYKNVKVLKEYREWWLFYRGHMTYISKGGILIMIKCQIVLINDLMNNVL